MRVFTEGLPGGPCSLLLFQKLRLFHCCQAFPKFVPYFSTVRTLHRSNTPPAQHPPQKTLIGQQQNNLLDVNHVTSESGVVGWFWEINILQVQIGNKKNPAQVKCPST